MANSDTPTLTTMNDETDSFEDAICIAKREEGKRLCDAVDDIRSFLESDLRNKTLSSQEELGKARFVFDALVREVYRRFYDYQCQLCYIEAIHGHP